MSSTPIQISHNRLVQLKPIEEQNDQPMAANQKRYFIYEIDDNKWQNVNPNGETDEALQAIKQKPAQLPIGIITVEQNSGTFSFEGDLTVTQEDQKLLFEAIR